MSAVNSDQITSAFFACGCMKEPIPPALREKIQTLGDHARIFPLEGYGYFFFTTPAYADVAENDEMIWIKLGHVLDGESLLSTADIIRRGWVTSSGVQVEAIQGSATLIGFLMKHQPRCFAYRNLLSASVLNYWSDGKNLIATDNLRLMADLLPDPQLNEDVLPQHFIYRAVYGDQTYLRDVSRLLVGEMLTWKNGTLKIDLQRDLRALSDAETPKPVNAVTVSQFFEQLKRVMGVCLKGNTHSSATMLSGGVDSSLLQAAINAQPDIDFPFPSFSFVVETPFFEFEVGYAKEAVRALGTDHTFVTITPDEYPDRLVQSVEVLGQPVSDDVRPCFLALADYISSHRGDINHLFHGEIADGLHGVSNSLEIVQGDKYRNWPIPLLRFLGIILAPVSQPKSYGAHKAAEMLLARKDISSPNHYLDSVGLYTDWEMVCRCFSQSAVHEALAIKRNLEKRYLDSDIMVEQTNALGLLTDSIDSASVVRQLGLYCGKEFIFPYGDEAIVKATFLFEPIGRYIFGHRVKPILKAALESQVSTTVTNKPKGWSGFGDDLMRWMREGVMREMVHAINRPAFMERADFARKIEQPDWFTWNLLTLDLFKKHVLARANENLMRWSGSLPQRGRKGQDL